MHKRKLVTRFLLLLILSGCSSPTGTLNAPVVPMTTSTPALTANTAGITPSPAATLESDRPQDCLDLTTTAFNGALLDGLLIAGSGQPNEDFHFLDPKTNKVLEIGEDRHRVLATAISPDRKSMLARTAGYYILRRADKIIRSEIPSHNDWIPDRWLDNERIEVLTSVEPHDIVVWNPFTDSQSRVHLSLPNPETIVQGYYNVMPQYSVVFAYLDSSLQRVVFSNQDFNSQDQSGSLILWDLKTQKEIASLPPPAADGAFLPFGWSPDGKEYVTPWPEGWGRNRLANELYLWDMDGNQKQLTNLNRQYAFANVEEPAWSPDGQHIGFWLRVGNSANLSPDKLRQWVAVVDTKTLETQIYCLADGMPDFLAHRLVWSPDGQRMLANIRLPNGDVEAVLIDLAHRSQSRMAGISGMLVEDWIAR